LKNQYYILLVYIFSGLLIRIVFDMLRLTRRLFNLSNLIVYIEDILFWVITGILLIFVIYYFCDGYVRVYQLLGLLFGIFVISFCRQ